MKRTRWFTLRRIALGLTVAALAPATAQAKPADFWNYDSQTGKKIANSSPSVSPEELATVWSAQAKPADFWNYDSQTGKKIANSSPSVSPGELAALWSVSSGATNVAGAPTAGDNGGYDFGAGIVSGFAMALILGAGGALVVIRHMRRAKVFPA
jgi:hypothetical protein